VQDQYYATRTYDKLGGFTAEIDKQFGNNLASISYDQLKSSSSAETEASIPAYGGVIVPAGSSQLFKTIMIRGQFALTPSILATLSNNTVLYTDTYTLDGGQTFQNSTHGYNAPRFSAAWRANSNTSVRAAVGWSIAPPYINLLTNPPGPPQPSQITPPTYYTLTANSGDIAPETAFGFDLGFDERIASYNTLSFDAYQTTLQNQFLNQTIADGTYTPPSGPNQGLTAPLYITKTANLGHSRYEGLELTFRRDPPLGFGYKLQGNLLRAYPYDLPAGFYDTAQGPNTANLGVIPNVNFQGSGFGWNGLGYTRIPYSTGYFEINHRAANASSFFVGFTYYGPNNGYNQPAFAVGNLGFMQPITQHASLNLTVSNFTSAYPSYYYNFIGGVPVALKGGQLGYTAGNVIGPSNAQLTLHVGL
jgi:outer membrane receptor protein involved in Fe transport